MTAWDDHAEQERLEQLAAALAKLDEGSSEFDRLVQTKDASELLDALGKLTLREVRRILFALVLIEQRRGESVRR
jgi:hypothetical protein